MPTTRVSKLGPHHELETSQNSERLVAAIERQVLSFTTKDPIPKSLYGSPIPPTIILRSSHTQRERECAMKGGSVGSWQLRQGEKEYLGEVMITLRRFRENKKAAAVRGGGGFSPCTRRFTTSQAGTKKLMSFGVCVIWCVPNYYEVVVFDNNKKLWGFPESAEKKGNALLLLRQQYCGFWVLLTFPDDRYDVWLQRCLL